MRSGPELIRDARMYLSRRLNRSLAPPDRVSVNVTLRCNLTCTICTTCYDAPELSTDEIKGIIDQTAAWGVEVFNPLGGEIELSLRQYGTGFDNPHARGTAAADEYQGMRDRDERGVRVKGFYDFNERVRFTGDVDLWQANLELAPLAAVT